MSVREQEQEKQDQVVGIRLLKLHRQRLVTAKNQEQSICAMCSTPGVDQGLAISPSQLRDFFNRTSRYRVLCAHTQNPAISRPPADSPLISVLWHSEALCGGPPAPALMQEGVPTQQVGLLAVPQPCQELTVHPFRVQHFSRGVMS